MSNDSNDQRQRENDAFFRGWMYGSMTSSSSDNNSPPAELPHEALGRTIWNVIENEGKEYEDKINSFTTEYQFEREIVKSNVLISLSSLIVIIGTWIMVKYGGFKDFWPRAFFIFNYIVLAALISSTVKLHKKKKAFIQKRKEEEAWRAEWEKTHPSK